MNNSDDKTKHMDSNGRDLAQTIRQQAEGMVQALEDLATEALGPEEAGRLLHELRVHQIELEMQNEELRRAQEELEVSRARYVDLYDFAPVGYVTLSEVGLILEANLTVATLLGVPRGALAGRPLSGFIMPEDQDIYYHLRQQLKEKRETQRCELRMLRTGGSPFWSLLEATVVWDEETGPPICRLVMSDITERKQLDEQLIGSKRMEMAGQIAGQVAHDFNNLLSPIMAYPELIKTQLPEGHPAIIYVDLILSAAQQMVAINQDLLTLSRRGHFNQEPTILNGLVKQALGHMSLPGSGLVMEVDLAADLRTISGSAAQLVRVVSNLIENARDAMLDKGLLRIKTANVYLDKDQPGYDRIKVGEYVRFQVQDTGCGMGLDTQQKIFEPFFTTKTTDRQRGTGLGLSVVQSVVQDHNGFVDINSQVGVGTTFSLYFPVCGEAIKVEQSLEVQLGGERILIVDDDEIHRQVAGALLKSVGYIVDKMASGEEALVHLKDQPVDLVLLDMVMPGGIDGLETYERIKEIRPEQKVIIVSGYAESDRIRKALALGVGGFLPKPITRRQLAREVRSELDRQ